MVYLTDPETNKELVKLFKPKKLNKNMIKGKWALEREKERMAEEETEEKKPEEETKEEDEPAGEDTTPAEPETSEETSDEKKSE